MWWKWKKAAITARARRMKKRVWKSNLRNLKEKPLRTGTPISEEGLLLGG